MGPPWASARASTCSHLKDSPQAWEKKTLLPPTPWLCLGPVARMAKWSPSCLRFPLLPILDTDPHPTSTHPEFLLQSDLVEVRGAAVQGLQVLFQGGHVQLRVSVEVVLQQGLVNERVLHLREAQGCSLTPPHPCTPRGPCSASRQCEEWPCRMTAPNSGGTRAEPGIQGGHQPGPLLHLPGAAWPPHVPQGQEGEGRGRAASETVGTGGAQVCSPPARQIGGLLWGQGS